MYLFKLNKSNIGCSITNSISNLKHIQSVLWCLVWIIVVQGLLLIFMITKFKWLYYLISKIPVDNFFLLSFWLSSLFKQHAVSSFSWKILCYFVLCECICVWYSTSKWMHVHYESWNRVTVRMKMSSLYCPSAFFTLVTGQLPSVL